MTKEEKDTIAVEETTVYYAAVIGISASISFIVVLALGFLGHILLVNKMTKARLQHLPKAKKVKVKKGKKKGKKGKK